MMIISSQSLIIINIDLAQGTVSSDKPGSGHISGMQRRKVLGLIIIIINIICKKTLAY